MSEIDWSRFLDLETGEIVDGAITDFEALLDQKSKEITKRIKSAKKRYDGWLDKLYNVYQQAGRDLLPRGIVIEYIMRQMDVSIDEYNTVYDTLDEMIDKESAENKTVATLVGAGGGLLLCKHPDGSPTAGYRKSIQSEHRKATFGVVVRKPRKDRRDE